MQTHNNKWKIDVKHGRFFIFTYTILITNLIFFISLFSSANALTFSFDALFSLLADGVNFIKTIRISDLIALIIQILSFSILVLSYIFGIIYFIFRINYARRGLLPRLSGIEIFLLIDLYLMAYNLFFAFLSMTKIWGVEWLRNNEQMWIIVPIADLMIFMPILARSIYIFVTKLWFFYVGSYGKDRHQTKLLLFTILVLYIALSFVTFLLAQPTLYIESLIYVLDPIMWKFVAWYYIVIPYINVLILIGFCLFTVLFVIIKFILFVRNSKKNRVEQFRWRYIITLTYGIVIVIIFLFFTSVINLWINDRIMDFIKDTLSIMNCCLTMPALILFFVVLNNHKDKIYIGEKYVNK